MKIHQPQKDKRLRILIFNWKDIKHPMAGGAEIVTQELAKRWIKEGAKVTLFCPGFKGAKKEETIDGIKIYRKGNRVSVYFWAFVYYKRFFQGKFDLLIDQINTIPFFTPLYVNSEKIVAFIHQLCREIWFYEVPLFSLFGYFLEPLFLKIYRKIPTLTVSNSTKEDLENLGFKKIKIIKEGISFKPLRELPDKEKNPTLVYLGRLIKSKRINHILKVFSLVLKKFPNASLWIIGRGAHQKKRLEKISQKLKIEKKVNFLGFVGEKEKIKRLKRAWALILTSKREGWGLAVTEAAALGTPALVYNVPGLRDSVLNKKTGLVINNNTPKHLAKESELFFKDKKLRTTLGQNSLAFAQKFDWESSAKKSLDFLKKIIND